MTVILRELTQKEREIAFARPYAKVDLREYMEAVREMEGGMAYAIPVNATTARALRLHFGKAAKQLGMSLKWAKTPKDATELIVELAE